MTILHYLFALLVGGWTSSAQAKDVSCVTAGTTSLVWDKSAEGWKGEARVQDGKEVVKFVNIGSGVSKGTISAVVGNAGASELSLVSTNPYTYTERTPSGTIVTWVYFPKEGTMGPQHDSFISLKAYDSVNPVSFTAVYRCK